MGRRGLTGAEVAVGQPVHGVYRVNYDRRRGRAGDDGSRDEGYLQRGASSSQCFYNLDGSEQWLRYSNLLIVI